MKYLFLMIMLTLIIGCTSSNSEVINMKLTSSVFENDGEIPSKYTCDGKNISPPLEISGVSEAAKSLVLIMDDPDAVKPAGKVWDHWIVFNIPTTTKEIEEGDNPQGVMGKNTRGNLTYGGPCPPDARHRYFFKLYALDTTLNLKEGSTKNEVEQTMQGHIIEQTTLIGTYEKK